MLVAILKAKEAIQEPLECPAMTREVVCGPAAYPVTLGIGICPMVQSPSGGLPLPLLYPGGLQFCPGGVQRRLLCPGGLQLCLFRPGGHQLHLLHPGWIPALFFFMDLHSMDLALHPSRLLHYSTSIVGTSGSHSFGGVLSQSPVEQPFPASLLPLTCTPS